MEWKDLSKSQKLSRLNQQLADIKTAQELLTEFARLTNDWIKKVQAAPNDQN